MRFAGLAPFTLLLVSPHDLPFNAPASYDCLLRSYYGTYGARRAFVVDRACMESSFSLLELGTAVRLSEEQTTKLVWVEQLHTAASLVAAPFHAELGRLLEDLRGHDVDNTAPQVPLGALRPAHPQLEILHHAQNGALLSASDKVLRSLDSRLPPYWRSSVFPALPTSIIPVPPAAKERLRETLTALRFDHVVASIVNGISMHRLVKDVRYLTGEDPASDIATRHSFSEDAHRAAAWLKTQFEQTGASCELHHFEEGYAPNVICNIASSTNTTETIVLGAHYDDRGSFGEVRAPGANDDGSGTGALLGIARAIARRGVVPRTHLQFCAFAGEEQGLVGSQAYARQLREQGADITAMIQADMLAYNPPDEPFQLGLSDPALVGTAELTQILANLSAIYSPVLAKISYTPYAGGSDHLSFHEEGFPAAQVNERGGYLQDPMYHSKGDVSEREDYSFDQIKSIAKVELAAVLHIAGFDLRGTDDMTGN
ncbi:Zn-dependent exopeptidase [Lenzites betulinus]|nr:Zn-dependent exopeptidase [Lenzites betulinus]